MIFLSIFMEGIIEGGNVGHDAAPILARLWIAGVIPFFVGLGLLINGLFVKGHVHEPPKPTLFEKEQQPLSLMPGETSEFKSAPVSVTEHTTRQLRDSDLK